MPSIADMKELSATQTPLFLFTFQLAPGAVRGGARTRWRWTERSTRRASSATTSSRCAPDSEEGIDSLSKLTVTLANADSYCSQIERNPGWKGAKVTVRFLFFDLKNGSAGFGEHGGFPGRGELRRRDHRNDAAPHACRTG